MQVDTIDLSNAKVLIRPEQAEGAKGKNVIIGEARPKNSEDKILAWEVMIEKTPDGKESIKITVKASRLGGASKFLTRLESACYLDTTGLIDFPAGQTGPTQGQPKMIKPKRPGVSTWKVNESKVRGEFAKQKPTFDPLLNKYTNQKAVPRDWPLKKRSRSPSHQNRTSSPWGESSKRKGDITTLFPSQKVYATMM
jgi:hypothetical protein